MPTSWKQNDIFPLIAHIITAEIVEDLQAALAQFAETASV
jgi:hypothetical protein